MTGNINRRSVLRYGSAIGLAGIATSTKGARGVHAKEAEEIERLPDINVNNNTSEKGLAKVWLIAEDREILIDSIQVVGYNHPSQNGKSPEQKIKKSVATVPKISGVDPGLYTMKMAFKGMEDSTQVYVTSDGLEPRLTVIGHLSDTGIRVAGSYTC